MLDSIFKILCKILKNRKFTKFIAVFTLLILVFIVSNTESSLVKTIVYFCKYNIVKFILMIIATLLVCINLELGLMFIILVSVVLGIHIDEKETFDNLPNLVDNSKLVSYSKNFKEPIKINSKNELDKKEEKNEQEKIQNKDEENKKKRRKKGYAISEDYFNEKKGKNFEDEEKDNVEEINLEGEDDTIEKELKRKFTNDIKKLEEFDSSSSDSSASESSDSSTDSSDSEKEIEEVSMIKAREHMLNKLRTGLKKRYIHD